MKKSNACQQEILHEIANAKLYNNLYSGRIRIEIPLASIGFNSYITETLLMYTSNYENIGQNPFGIGKGWKLNIQQYIMPYDTSYNMDDFNDGDFIYIDDKWNIYNFTKYKTEGNKDVYYSKNAYYMRLYIDQTTDEGEIIDVNGTRYIFNSEGYLEEIRSNLNNLIVKQIEYQNNKIVSYYDRRKLNSKIMFEYDEFDQLVKIYNTSNTIVYQIHYDEGKICYISKIKNNKTKKVCKFLYNDEKLTDIIELKNNNGFKLEYSNSFPYKVSTIKRGFYSFSKEKIGNENNEFINKKLFCEENNYVVGMKKEKYQSLLLLKEENIKENTQYQYSNDYSYTDVVNNRGVKVRYYFDYDGKIVSEFNCIAENMFKPIIQHKGIKIPPKLGEGFIINGNPCISNDEIDIENENGQSILFKYDFDIDQLQCFKKYLAKGDYKLRFFVKSSNGINLNDNVCFSYNQKYVNYNDFELKKQYATMIKTKPNVWQEIIIPLRFNYDLDNLENVSIEITKASVDSTITISYLQVEQSPNTYLYIENNDVLNNDILTIDDQDYEINSNFFLTQADIFQTYKNLYLSRIENKYEFDLVYNNGTKVKNVSSIVLKKSNTEFKILNKLPNFHFETIYLKKEYVNNQHVFRWVKEKDSIKYLSIFQTEQYMVFNKLCEGSDFTNVLYQTNYSTESYKLYNFTNVLIETKSADNVYQQWNYDDYYNILSVCYGDNINNLFKKEEYIYPEYETSLKREVFLKVILDENENNFIEFEYDFEMFNITSISNKEQKKLFEYDLFGERIKKIVFESKNENNGQNNCLNPLYNGIMYVSNNSVEYSSSTGEKIRLVYDRFCELKKIYKDNIKVCEYEHLLLEDGTRLVKQKKYYQLNNYNLLEWKYDKYDNLIEHKVNDTVATYLYDYDSDESTNFNPILKQILDGFILRNNNSSQIDFLYKKDLIDENYEGVLISNYLLLLYNHYSECPNELKKNYFPEMTLENNNLLNSYILRTSSGITEYSCNVVRNEDGDYEEYIYSSYINNLQQNSMNNKSAKIYNYYLENNFLNGQFKIEEIPYLCYDIELDDFGRVSYLKSGVENHANNVQTFFKKSYEYNENNTVNAIEYENNNPQSATKFHRFECTYDHNNNVTNIIEKNFNDVELRNQLNNYNEYEYEYDKFGRITCEKYYENNQLKPDQSYNYVYDEAGHLIMISSLENTTISSFIYDKNTLTKWVDKSANIHDVFYNTDGQIFSISDDIILDHNSRGLVEECYKLYGGSQNILKITFEYDSFGRRIRKLVQEKIGVNDYKDKMLVLFFYDNDKLVQEKRYYYSIENSTPRTEEKFFYYFYNNEGVCGMACDGIYLHFLRDPLGNIESIKYENKEILNYKYNAWGIHSVNIIEGFQEMGELLTTIRMIAEANPFRYKGYYYDVETQLYWVSSRYYSPELCRWISPDSIEYLDPESINGLNLYSYANNNPIGIAYGSSSVGVSVANQLINQNLSLLIVPNLGINKNNYSSSVHWKNELFATDWPSFLVFSKTKGALLDWGLSIYKGSLYFDEAENDSIYIGVGNISAFVGYNVEEDKYGVFADANVLSVGYDGRYIDAGISVVGVGFILGWEDKKFRFKIDPPGWFGFDISIDFGQIIKDIFGWEW